MSTCSSSDRVVRVRVTVTVTVRVRVRATVRVRVRVSVRVRVRARARVRVRVCASRRALVLSCRCFFSRYSDSCSWNLTRSARSSL